MKNIAAVGVLERIRRLAPQGSVPPYRTVEEWREWQPPESPVAGGKNPESFGHPASAQQMLVCKLSGAERRAKIRAEPGQIHS